jgi:hypothetical protein
MGAAFVKKNSHKQAEGKHKVLDVWVKQFLGHGNGTHHFRKTALLRFVDLVAVTDPATQKINPQAAMLLPQTELGTFNRILIFFSFWIINMVLCALS